MWTWIRWALIGLLILMVAFVGYRLSVSEDVNARVAAEIQADPDGARAQKTMLLTLADGRMYPVNYPRDGESVYVGIDGRWWRDFLGDGQRVEMLIRGDVAVGHARTVLDKPALKQDVFSRLRPTVPGWLPDWLNGKLVVIALEPGG